MIEYYLDRPIAYHRAFIALGCGLSGAVMLSQALYWSKRTTDGDGWFYKTQVEWEEETGMTRYEQEGARKKLRGLGILEEMKRGVPCKVHYRVNADRLLELLDQHAEKQQTQFGEKPQTSSGKSSNTVRGELANSDAENQQTNTEITQRLPKTTTDRAASASKQKRKQKLPDDFQPTNGHKKMADEYGVDLQYEFEQFRDYHLAKGSSMLDWNAALRTWLRNAKKFKQGGNQQNRTGYMKNEKLDFHKGVNPDGTF